MTTDVAPTLPGRLGVPDLVLRDEPRADPGMIAAFAPLGLDVHPAPAPVTAGSPLDAKLEFCAAVEEAYEGLFEALCAGLSPVAGVSRATETITGVDGNQIPLYIHRPANANGPVPCVVQIHGGGMVILKGSSPISVHWRDALAASGMVVVGVEFRNGAGAPGNHPFPAGLDDCASGLDWVFANRDQLGVSKIVVSGESGGGNLSLATALKAKREGRLDRIGGVYAMCPYISNAYADKPAELPSLFENDGYILDVAMMAALASVYDPEGSYSRDPLCWPSEVSGADLEGLPPHVISVNELDPLRDEGLAYFRRLGQVGVSAVSRTVNGTCHAGDLILPAALPDVYAATVRDIKGFADSL